LTHYTSSPPLTIRSTRRSCDIVSLIFIRDFFREIGEPDMETLQAPTMDVFPYLVDDIGRGLVFFLLLGFSMGS
jgi:hypothetical protein